MTPSLASEGTIELDEIRVRRGHPYDLDGLWQYHKDPNVHRFQFFESNREGLHDNLIQQHPLDPELPGVTHVFVVEHRADRMLIGDLSLEIESIESGQGSLGFTMHPGYWRRGYGSRAAAAVLGIGFEVLRLHRIYAACHVENEGSWRLMERIGMRREGHFLHDNRCSRTGEWIDDYLYAILEQEWRERPAADERAG